MPGRRKVKIGPLVLSTVRQPVGAPLVDSCTVIEREHGWTWLGDQQVPTEKVLWTARGFAIKVGTPPFETQPEAVTVSWVGAPLPPSGPMVRSMVRGWRRRLRIWPLPASLGRFDVIDSAVDERIRDFCRRG